MKRYPTFAAAVLLLVWSACDSVYEDMNTNPNVPLEVAPDLLLPTIIRTPVNETVEMSWGIGNIVVQQTAKIQFTREDRYDWNNGDFAGTWNTFYATLRDIENVRSIATERSLPHYEGVALVMRAWVYSMLTDAWGDVPYSEAIKGKTESNFQPTYDPQEEIYAGILADLARANELLSQSGADVNGDILYDGDMSKWRKLANSLRIRALMRISNKRNVSADLQAIVGNAGQNPIFTSNADNAALEYLPAFPNQFPVHTYRVGSFDEFRLSKTMGDKLIALNDPRLFVYARPTASSAGSENPEYVGVPNGLSDQAALSYNGGTLNISRLGRRYFEEPNAADGLIMTYAELQFLLAEAAQRGLIPGDPESFYREGIQASFDYYGVAPPEGYFEQAGVAFDPSNGLELIATQKWIALFFNGFEAWFDWRRTGLPALNPSVENVNDDRIPVRFEYPLIEQSLNADNRAEAVTRQGPDDINTLVWWDK